MSYFNENILIFCIKHASVNFAIYSLDFCDVTYIYNTIYFIFVDDFFALYEKATH